MVKHAFLTGIVVLVQCHTAFDAVGRAWGHITPEKFGLIGGFCINNLKKLCLPCFVHVL